MSKTTRNLYIIAGFFVAVAIIYIVGVTIFRGDFARFIHTLAGIFYKGFNQIDVLASPLIKIIGFLILIGCFVSSFKHLDEIDHDYTSILPLIAFAMFGLSCLYMAWGFALVGMIGLSVFVIVKQLR